MTKEVVFGGGVIDVTLIVAEVCAGNLILPSVMTRVGNRYSVTLYHSHVEIWFRLTKIREEAVCECHAGQLHLYPHLPDACLPITSLPSSNSGPPGLSKNLASLHKPSLRNSSLFLNMCKQESMAEMIQSSIHP